MSPALSRIATRRIAAVASLLAAVVFAGAMTLGALHAVAHLANGADPSHCSTCIAVKHAPADVGEVGHAIAVVVRCEQVVAGVLRGERPPMPSVGSPRAPPTRVG